MEVVIDYEPRPLQRVIHTALEEYLRAVAVCHRRFGKTVLAINHLQKSALRCRKPRPRFAYLAPTYTQGKGIAWDYMKHYAQELPHGTNESELRLDYPSNDSRVRIFGADNPDSLRGMYFDGIVLDEFGLMPPKTFDEVISPTLIDRGGWAFFIGTPNGKNQFYDIVQYAKAHHTEWFFAEYKASQTGILPAEELAKERQKMTQDQYEQEYECSFEASVKGAVYAREVTAARAAGRITVVPYDPLLSVDTDWDLGYGDATAIWFSQTEPGGRIRLFDYYEATGQGLHHYAKILKEKPYAYGNHWAPHDIQQAEIGSGHTRYQIAQSLGLNFLVTPKVPKVEDGIYAARTLFEKCWFDAERCQRGIEALQHYRWDYNKRIDGYTHLPVHDWASHAADAFRGLAFRHYNKLRNPERDAAAAQRRAQIDRNEPFRWNQRASGQRGGY